MKIRLLLLLAIVGLVALGIWSIKLRRSKLRDRPVATKVAPPEVPIQDGKTLDFSAGKAEVKDSDGDRAALQKSVSEMDAAAGNVTFSAKTPSPSPAAPKP